MSFLDALRSRVLLGDGANGTLLAQWGFAGPHYDLANLQAPDLVRAAHRAYFEAGADFVETNTFQANRLRLAEAGVDIAEVNRAGARLAREAAGPGRFVLGAIGPCGKPLEPIGQVSLDQVFESVREQALVLWNEGVDGFMLETFIEPSELATAVRAVQSVCDLPIVAGKAFVEDGETLAAGAAGLWGEEASRLGVAAIGANCIVGPQRMLDIVRQLVESTSLPVCAMPTPGLPMFVRGQVAYDNKPEYFARAVARIVEEGARIVGGCCGTTPDHIRALRRLLDSGSLQVRPHPAVRASRREDKPLAESEPTELALKLGRKFIVSVELDLPRGLNLESVFRGCRSLKVKGADLIDISDGARARLRMNPLSISALIQNRVGIEVMMHFSCRDRNLLAMQADLLGSHALGVRNILAVTGDPAHIGDYPSATSVFDVDSIGLVRILSRFNEGIDLAGYGIGVKCAFTIAVAFNPTALDPQLERERLRRKADAGAHIVYTQPIFEERGLEIALQAGYEVGLPVFVGVMPLRSSRHAEFMHNEVPGIDVPEWLRRGLADAPDEEAALRYGIEQAQKLAHAIRQKAQGLYLMPPFGSARVAEAVLEAVL